VELLELLKNSSPDVVILDISMPRLKGLEAARIIKEQYPEIEITILTMHREKTFFHKAKEIGVNGYVLKDEADTALNTAIQAVLQDQTYYSPLVAG